MRIAMTELVPGYKIGHKKTPAMLPAFMPFVNGMVLLQ
jgi:hypothetical protein